MNQDLKEKFNQSKIITEITKEFLQPVKEMINVLHGNYQQKKSNMIKETSNQL